MEWTFILLSLRCRHGHDQDRFHVDQGGSHRRLQQPLHLRSRSELLRLDLCRLDRFYLPFVRLQTVHQRMLAEWGKRQNPGNGIRFDVSPLCSNLWVLWWLYNYGYYIYTIDSFTRTGKFVLFAIVNTDPIYFTNLYIFHHFSHFASKTSC